jgi:hypothetical protein
VSRGFPFSDDFVVLPGSPIRGNLFACSKLKTNEGIIMHTELKYKRDFFPEPPPLPPTPHFDLASIAAAKPVQPLRWRRTLRYSRDLLRPGTAVLLIVLGIATMAQWNKPMNVAPATRVTAGTAAAAVDSSPDVDMESTRVASLNGQPIVISDGRRHRRHHPVPREMFDSGMYDSDQPSVYATSRARLVRVAQ